MHSLLNIAQRIRVLQCMLEGPELEEENASKAVKQFPTSSVHLCTQT